MLKSSRVLALTGRELKSYCVSPVAYIVTAIFLIFTGFFFFKDFFYYNQAEMRGLFQLFPVLFSFVVPALTMRQFTEERQSGTFELLATFPMTPLEIVAGKFIASLVSVLALVAPTIVYLFSILTVGSPDIGPVLGGYAGTVFLACACVSIGLLMSSLSKNQIVSFITAWALIFSLWLVDKVVFFLPAPFRGIRLLGLDFHFQNIARGIIDSRDLLYFFSLTVLALVLTARVVEERR